MAQVKSKIKGEYTYPSEYSEAPEGALRSAKNCVINRDSVAEPRRGFNTYRSISASALDRIKNFLFYKTSMLAHFGTTLALDNANPFTAYSGAVASPTHGSSYTPRIKYIEANSNLLFLSNTGIRKLDAIAGTIGTAGAPRGLDVNLTASGATGFMTNNTQVAYRLLWGYKDANQNLILGSPSQRAVIINTGGTSINVTVNSSIPQEVTVNWFYQVYRTGLSVDQNTDPNDEEGLVYEANPTTAEITAKAISFVDSTPDDLRGATLYTSPSQEGIAQSNDTPPSAKDLCVFKNCALYANTIQKQNLTITLLGAGGTSGLGFLSTTGDTTNGSAIVLNIPSTANLAAGQAVSGTGIPAGTTILSVDSATRVTLTANATATNATVTLLFQDTLVIASLTYTAASAEDIPNRKFKVFTSGTPAQNIADTANSLVKVINRNTGNTTIYAYYFSNIDDLPGKIYLEARALGASSFAVTASSHVTAWNPQLPTSGTTVSSDAEQKKNRLHVSKVQRPEAAPKAQYFDVGSADKDILRVIPLRDAVIIMKEDGFFRLTGTTPANFQIDPLDLTTYVIGAETAVALNNQVVAITNQGISTVSDTGVGVISRPIEDQIVSKLNWSNWATTAFAVAYETERQYILWVPDSTSDTYGMKTHVYNTFTTAWTHWDKHAAIAAVNPTDNKLYLGSGTTNGILQERKALDYTDLADEDIAVTIVSSTGKTVVLNTVDGISIGDVLVQTDVAYAEVTAVDQTTFSLTMDVTRPWVTAAATVKTSYECRVEFIPQYCGNPGIMKHIREVHPLLKVGEFRTAQLIFSSDLIFSEDSVDIVGFRSFLWGYFPWGEIPWGGYFGIFKGRSWPHSDYQRCTWLNVTFRSKAAYNKFGLAGMEYTFEPLTERTGT